MTILIYRLNDFFEIAKRFFMSLLGLLGYAFPFRKALLKTWSSLIIISHAFH